jgi:ABC-type multidrug transport system fused ATPase/permease subunit
MKAAKKILYLLLPEERKKAGLLLVMILIMTLLDTIGVASILPFAAVIANPDIIETSMILNKMFQASNIFGIENKQDFLFGLGVLVFLMLLISLSFKTITIYIQVRFILMREYSIGKRLVEGYLHQPYSWFLSHHSADLGKTILSEVSQVVGKGIAPLITLISSSMVTIAIVILLVLIDPKLALIVGFSLGVANAIVYRFARKYLKRFGKERLKSNKLRFMAVNEAFSAAKEVKLSGLEQTYIKRFSDPAEAHGRSQAFASIIEQLPRFILEIIAFGGIMLMILYLMSTKGSFNNALPIISLYAFAGYRLMPALQQIYSSLVNISFAAPSVDALIDDLKKLQPFNYSQSKDTISLNKIITLKNISYNYPNSSQTVLNNLNLSIPAKSTIGLVGATGSGKTTTVDIILGLLESQKGTLEIDGKVITRQNARAWQQSIGYVPQHIYLSDDTIAGNIAFGVKPKDINQKKIEKASKIANLHEFVINKLPKQYHTTIGENGVRLSGGQRQRIGIARALYHSPQLLILDEATSALDNQTEQIVMEAINNLSKNITIILIAHRLSTVKNCDNIFFLENGEVKAEGAFEELAKISKSFSSMAKNY